jgi:H+/Cl- antiporter ClcA
MKIIYTESGQKALEEYKLRQVQVLEERVTSLKYVFGDDVVEVTASDIKQASETRSSPLIRVRERQSLTRSLLAVYVVLGILMGVFGLFYDQIFLLLRRNPTQLLLSVSGISVSLASYLMLARLRSRDREIEKMEQIEQIEQWERIQKRVSENT